MGTNYYLYRTSFEELKAKLAAAEDLGELTSIMKNYSNQGETLDDGVWHIGKSSGGWKFGLHIATPWFDERWPDYKPAFPQNLKEWLPYLKAGTILDEYGKVVAYDDMLDIIKRKGWKGPHQAHKMDKTHCLDNTHRGYDHIIGWFS